MLPAHVEFVVYERRKDLLAEAERVRLIKSLPRQPFSRSGRWRHITIWIGGQMVKWGLKLQGQSLTLQETDNVHAPQYCAKKLCC